MHRVAGLAYERYARRCFASAFLNLFEERFISEKSLFITIAALAFLLVLVTFGFHSKMGGYTTSMSDILKLYEIASKTKA